MVANFREQLSLLDQIRAEELKLADELERSYHPSTALTRHEAGRSIEGAKPTMRERVFSCIELAGPVTDEQIAEILGMNANTVRPRRLELCRAGRIESCGAQTTRSGRRAVAWVVSQRDERSGA